MEINSQKKSDDSRKYTLFFSAILLGYQYLGLVIDTIPYTSIRIYSQANIPIILTFLITFFCSQFIYYWFKQEKEDKSRFEFASSIPIAIIAIIPVCYGYLNKFGIDWKVIFSTILILLAGGLLALVVDFIITILFSLRNAEEMKKLGLGKVPTASKALMMSLVFLIPLNALGLFLLAYFSYILPVPLNSDWLTFFLIPTLLFNLGNLINLLKCLGPQEVREKALGRLRIFRKAMDSHEIDYQYLGLEKPESYEIPPICHFARYGHLVDVQKLLNSGVDPNSQDSRGWCPLMMASAEGHPNIVELLLEHGADPNLMNHLGRSAIMFASNYGFYEIAKALLEKGATPNPSSKRTNHPPLSAAARQGHLDIARLLIAHGANATHIGEGGATALDIAMKAGHGDVAKYLRNIENK